MVAIEIQGLSKRFVDVAAVDDLSFSARAGAVTGFLGPNGAGKTTTLRMLLGLVTPTTGIATIDGQPYAELTSPFRRVGAVLEAPLVGVPQSPDSGSTLGGPNWFTSSAGTRNSLYPLPSSIHSYWAIWVSGMSTTSRNWPTAPSFTSSG
jgi:ABC transporter